MSSSGERMYKKKQDEIIERIQSNIMKDEQLDLLLKQHSVQASTVPLTIVPTSTAPITILH